MKQETSITNECVRILYERATASNSTTVISSGILVYLFKEQISPPLLWTWFFIMMAIALVRYWMLFDYNKNKDKISDHKKFETRYSYATGLTGLGWAAGLTVVLSLPVHEYHTYGLLFLTVIISLSVHVFSSSLKTMYFYIAPPLGIIIPMLLSHGGDEVALGIGLIVFSAMVIRIGRENNATLIDTLTLQLRTQMQAENLELAKLGKTQAEGRLEDVFRVAPEAIITFNNDMNIILFNDAAERIFGYKKSEVLGKNLNTLLPKSAWEMHDKHVQDFASSNKDALAMKERPQLKGTRKNGETFPITASVSKVGTASGKIFVVMISDITARINAEKSLRISQQRLIMHREQSPIGIIEWNPKFEVVAWNPAAEHIFGFSSKEVMGKVILDLILPESAEIVVADAWNALIENSGGDHTVNENLTKDKKVILCEWHNTSLVDGDGNVIGVTSLVSDITERHNTEESLRISQQRLLLHREQSPVGILEWNTKFEVTAWNPAVEKIFGYTKEEVMGKYILDWILPESARPQVERLWEDLLANDGGSYSINENVTKDGQVILCEWHNTPLVNDEGNVIGVSVLVEDITEKQKQEENERQMQKMDAIGQLTGGIAHDFNNMLGVILGFSGLLKKSLDGVNPKQLKYCDQILKAGERAKNLTSNLLEFSSTAPSSEETIDINEILSSMKQMLETTLTARIKLILELGEDIWSTCLDKARLEDAILNMSINAMHAMPEGGKLTMNSSTKHLTKQQSGKLGLPMGDYVVLSIADTGSGMPQEVQKQIFDPFFTTKGTEGTGLGLSQVYGFAQQAGGTIEVFSEMGQGTRLNLYFPRCIKDKVIKLEDEAAAPVTLKQNDGTILVVDDEEALLSLNEDILATAGYNVLLANGAEQALEMLKDKRVDLMLSDVIMPEVNGYQLAAEVEKLYPDVKIQMVSGYSEDHNKSVANNKLYKQRLHKPVAVDTLLHRIAQRLDKTG